MIIDVLHVYTKLKYELYYLAYVLLIVKKSAYPDQFKIVAGR